jgi:hypothetical protein
MGAVFRPKDLPACWRKIAREAIEDFSPDTKDSVIKIIDSWEGTKSEEKLRELLGHDNKCNNGYRSFSFFIRTFLAQ